MWDLMLSLLGTVIVCLPGRRQPPPPPPPCGGGLFPATPEEHSTAILTLLTTQLISLSFSLLSPSLSVSRPALSFRLLGVPRSLVLPTVSQ